MFPSFNVSDGYEKLNIRNKEIVEEIFNSIDLKKEVVLLAAHSSVYVNTGMSGMIYVLQEGIVSYKRNNKLIFNFDKGDLFGIEQLICADLNVELSIDFAVVAEEYHLTDFYGALAKVGLIGLWTSYLSNLSELYSIMISNSLVHSFENPPETCTFEPNEVVLEQGAVDDNVYTLVEGRLEVRTDGIKVGEIAPDEIFGAMSALAGTPRNSTVIAKKFSVVLRLPRDSFKDLMRNRPFTLMKMMEDLPFDLMDCKN